jgi:hypothetical protein
MGGGVPVGKLLHREEQLLWVAEQEAMSHEKEEGMQAYVWLQFKLHTTTLEFLSWYLDVGVGALKEQHQQHAHHELGTKGQEPEERHALVVSLRPKLLFRSCLRFHLLLLFLFSFFFFLLSPTSCLEFLRTKQACVLHAGLHGQCQRCWLWDLGTIQHLRLHPTSMPT